MQMQNSRTGRTEPSANKSAVLPFLLPKVVKLGNNDLREQDGYGIFAKARVEPPVCCTSFVPRMSRHQWTRGRQGSPIRTSSIGGRDNGASYCGRRDSSRTETARPTPPTAAAETGRTRLIVPTPRTWYTMLCHYSAFRTDGP
ncbi:hypothetical protein MTO96_012047 [Rhipicephalus appendiculatus]